MTDDTKKFLTTLVQRELGNIRDDLTRARMQRDRDHNWRSGNGETIVEVVAGYELREAKAALALEEVKSA